VYQYTESASKWKLDKFLPTISKKKGNGSERKDKKWDSQEAEISYEYIVISDNFLLIADERKCIFVWLALYS
jgi:predicted neuraminidase